MNALVDKLQSVQTHTTFRLSHSFSEIVQDIRVEVKRVNLEVTLSLTSDLMFDSVCIEEASASSENPGVLRDFPTERMENRPKEKPAEGKKKKGVLSFFRSGWKGAKRLLHRRDPDRVVHLTPQLDHNDSDPRLIRNTPTADKDLVVPVSLPGQVCEDVCVPEPSRTERILYTDPDPDSSPVADLGDEIPKQGNERSKSHAFFKRLLKAIKKPFRRKSRKEAFPDSVDSNPNFLKELYELGDSLGRGGTAEVFKAVRKSDGQEVAIKRMFKSRIRRPRQIPGCSGPLPTEVELLLTLRHFPVCPYIIQMYEWAGHGAKLWISLEFPQPCVTIGQFIYNSPEGLTEVVARGLMRQLVMAVQHCINCDVFHNDIHNENILVNPNTLELKLIDFGSGYLLDEDGYRSKKHKGRWMFRPPEVFKARKFYAITTNVWKLGVMLYLMVNKELPFSTNKKITKACPPAQKAGLSDACYDLICQCLKRNPVERPTLEQILEHEWFQLDQ